MVFCSLLTTFISLYSTYSTDYLYSSKKVYSICTQTIMDPYFKSLIRAFTPIFNLANYFGILYNSLSFFFRLFYFYTYLQLLKPSHLTWLLRRLVTVPLDLPVCCVSSTRFAFPLLII